MIKDVKGIISTADFADRVVTEFWNEGEVAIKLPIGDKTRKSVTYQEAEYELAVSKLHGQYAQITENDWKELKRISDKYGF